MPEPVYVVFNPESGKGRGARLIAPVLTALSAGGGTVAHALTLRPGDEARVADEALRLGFRKIVAVGGDGTWSNVAGAILRSGLPVRLGLVPAGTGCDLAKSLAIPPRDVAGCAAIIHNGAARTIDVGRVEGRHFLNVVGFGFDIAVIEDSRNVRWLGGDLLYLYCALRQIYAFPGFPVEVEAEGGGSRRHELLMLIIANARVFGGGFRIAPRADLADARLDAVLFKNMPPSRRLPLMGQLLQGTHESSPEVEAAVARSFRLRFPTPPRYETDGEWNQAGGCEMLVEAVPAALQVLAPAEA